MVLMWHAKNQLEITKFQASSLRWIGHLLPQMCHTVSYMHWVLSLFSHPYLHMMLVRILSILP